MTENRERTLWQPLSQNRASSQPGMPAGSKAPLRFFASAAFGLEGVAAGELKRMGFAGARAENGGVAFEASWEGALRANLALRTADRILLCVAEFEAKSFDALFDGTNAADWSAYLPKNAAFPISAHCARSQLMSPRDTQAIVKKAVAERLMSAYHVSVLPENGPVYPILVSIHENRVRLCLNTSGDALNKRGYRTWNGEAPLRETLAAAIALLSSWRPGMPLLDPMCGTGTLLCEAAMLALNRAPGIQRAFQMESWPVLDQLAASRLREEMRDTERKETLRFFGSDLDPEAIDLCKKHIKQAGLSGQIRLETCDARSISGLPEGGAVLVNPPYGERLGDRKQAEACIRVLSGLQQRLPTWSLTAISPHPAFERLYGRRAAKRRRVYNGRLECSILTFSPLYLPDSP